MLKFTDDSLIDFWKNFPNKIICKLEFCKILNMDKIYVVINKNTTYAKLINYIRHKLINRHCCLVNIETQSIYLINKNTNTINSPSDCIEVLYTDDKYKCTDSDINKKKQLYSSVIELKVCLENFFG